jgi:uncharacterized membrane protein YcfT
VLNFTLMDVPARKGERVAWADIAKAFSIILLVYYHLVWYDIPISELFVFLRMPLFFFVSGLFGYRVVTATSFRELMRDKVANFIYLYVLWEIIFFFVVRVVRHYVWGKPELDPLRLLSILWDPLFNSWFLYALAIAFLIAWCLRRAPAWAVLVGSVAVYCISVATDDWVYLSFPDRIARLFPLFWLGLMTRPLVFRLVEQHWRLWPIFLGLYLAAAYLVYPTAWKHVGPLTLTISLVGISAALLLARHVSRFEALAAPLRYFGGATLYIYLMHRIVIPYLKGVFYVTDTSFTGETVVLLVVTVPLCAVVGKWIAAQPPTAWLFTAPWAGSRSRRAAPKPMLAE